MNDYYVGQRVLLTGRLWDDEYWTGENWIGTLATVISVDEPHARVSPDKSKGGSYWVVKGWEVEPV